MSDSSEDDHRSTRELLETLDGDYRQCHQNVIRRLNLAERLHDGTSVADTDFDARQLIRSAFAYIEGATYVLKIEASFNAEEHEHPLLPQQQHFIFEADFELNDRGEVLQRPAKIPLVKNIRFAFAVFAEANGITHTLNTQAPWWSQLLASIKVRDRLMHPRSPTDLDVSPKEVIAMIGAKNGFDSELLGLLSARKA